jgi:hypothetical protein
MGAQRRRWPNPVDEAAALLGPGRVQAGARPRPYPRPGPPRAARVPALTDVISNTWLLGFRVDEGVRTRPRSGTMEHGDVRSA